VTLSFVSWPWSVHSPIMFQGPKSYDNVGVTINKNSLVVFRFRVIFLMVVFKSGEMNETSIMQK
jgi:hypothetical protein